MKKSPILIGALCTLLLNFTQLLAHISFDKFISDTEHIIKEVAKIHRIQENLKKEIAQLGMKQQRLLTLGTQAIEMLTAVKGVQEEEIKKLTDQQDVMEFSIQKREHENLIKAFQTHISNLKNVKVR